MTVRIITAPSVEPVTLTEAKLHLRETDTAQDDLITALIVAARQYAENYTRRAFAQRTLELTLPCFPADSIIELPQPPLQSVTSVKYIDFAGTLQTVLASAYQVDSYREPGLVKPAYLSFWQLTRDDFNAVQVRYVAGYAAAGSPDDYAYNIPAAIKHWIKVRVATLYEHREQLVVDQRITAIEVPRSIIDGLLDPYIVRLF